MHHRAGHRIAVVEEVIGIEMAVAQELEQPAVERTRARLGNGIDRVPHTPAILRREGVGLNLELLQLVDRGYENQPTPIARAVPMTIHQQSRSPKTPAPKIKCGTLLV